MHEGFGLAGSGAFAVVRKIRTIPSYKPRCVDGVRPPSDTVDAALRGRGSRAIEVRHDRVSEEVFGISTGPRGRCRAYKPFRDS